MTLKGIDFKSLDWFAIIKGCSQHIANRFKAEKDFVASVQEYRLKNICQYCKLNIDGQCCTSESEPAVIDFDYHRHEPRKKGQYYSGCGCSLACKTANMDEDCPLGKWLHT